MGSGLIYAVIVGLWAVVLVPMWLRRHESETETRQVDRFSKAMGTLSRRSPSVGSRSVVMPPRSTTSSVSDAADSHRIEPVFVSRPRSAVQASSRAQAARRRRMILMGLGVLLMAASGAAALGFLGMWAPLTAVALVVGYLGLLRVSARAAAPSRVIDVRRPAAAPRPTASIDLTEPARPVAEPVEHATVVIPRRISEPTPIDIVAEEIDNVWRPTEVPLPTYVTAPAATAVPRVLDREAGSWNAERMLEHVEASRAPIPEPAPAMDDVFDRELFDESGVSDVEEILDIRGAFDVFEQRRAVND